MINPLSNLLNPFLLNSTSRWNVLGEGNLQEIRAAITNAYTLGRNHGTEQFANKVNIIIEKTNVLADDIITLNNDLSNYMLYHDLPDLIPVATSATATARQQNNIYYAAPLQENNYWTAVCARKFVRTLFPGTRHLSFEENMKLIATRVNMPVNDLMEKNPIVIGRFLDLWEWQLKNILGRSYYTFRATTA